MSASERKVNTKQVLAAIGVLAVVGLLIWVFLIGRRGAAAEREREQPVEVPARVSVENNQTVVTLDEATQTRAGVAVEALRPTIYRQELRAYGTVEDLQRLGDLRSGYASARAQVDRARASVDASQREYERLKTLYSDRQNVSAKALEAAAATFRSDRANAEAATVPLRILAATAREEWGLVLGQWLIDGSMQLDRLLDRRDLLIQATLPPDIAIPAPPETASVQVGDRLRVAARLVSSAGRTDPRIQGPSFFYLASAESGLLPGMNVVALLPSGKEMSGAILPESAVVRWQGKAWAYLEVEPTKFARREIPTNIVADGNYVVSDFPAEARVVIQGAQMLLSEELRAQIQVGEEGTQR